MIEINIKYVSEHELLELKNYLENNCWDWKQKEKSLKQNEENE